MTIRRIFRNTLRTFGLTALASFAIIAAAACADDIPTGQLVLKNGSTHGTAGAIAISAVWFVKEDAPTWGTQKEIDPILPYDYASGSPGQFAFTSMPVGTYKVRFANDTGTKSKEWHDVEIEVDRTTTVTLTAW